MTKKSLPIVKVVYINPNEYYKEKDILYLHQQSISIFAYSGGINKYLNERIIPDPLTRINPMALKKFNFATMYKDHLLLRAKGMVEEWQEFLKQDEITIGVLYQDYVDEFQSTIEEVIEIISKDPRFQCDKQEEPEYDSVYELACI